MQSITLDAHTVDSIKKISYAATHPTKQTKLKSILTGVALTVTCLCSANMMYLDDETHIYPVMPHKIMEVPHTLGEQFMADPVAIYKIASWIHNKYGMPTQISYDIVQTVTSSALSLSQDPFLILAIIEVESNFNPSATSNKNAQGLTQVNANIHGSIKNFKIQEQVEAGLSVLLDIQYRAKTDDLTELLQRYNGNLKDKDAKYAGKVLAMKKVFEDLVVNDLYTVSSEMESNYESFAISDTIITNL